VHILRPVKLFISRAKLWIFSPA